MINLDELRKEQERLLILLEEQNTLVNETKNTLHRQEHLVSVTLNKLSAINEVLEQYDGIYYS